MVIPLESNPEVFTSLAHTLGLSPILLFHDVYSLTDPDLLAFLPNPVLATVVLFPMTETYDTDRKLIPPHLTKSSQINWFKQTIGNGCGFYAVLHALTNISTDFIVQNLVLSNLILKNVDEHLSIEEDVKLVELVAKAVEMDANFGSQGQTEAPSAEDDVFFHFLAFVKGKDGHVYELDGRRNGPLDLGLAASGSHLLQDSIVADRVQFYIDNTSEVDREKFAVMALAPGL